MRLVVAVAVALGLSLLSPGAAAEPLRFRTPAQCVTEGGSEVHLDPGRYLSESDWLVLDEEIIRLQDAETRLRAENSVLTRQAESSRWRLVLGIAAGVAAGYTLFRVSDAVRE